MFVDLQMNTVVCIIECGVVNKHEDVVQPSLTSVVMVFVLQSSPNHIHQLNLGG